MFERFTENARQVVQSAQEFSRGRDLEKIEVTALLVGLARAGEDGGLAGAILKGMGVTEQAIVESLPLGAPMEADPDGGQTPFRQVPFTDEAKHVLELSLREALRLGHNYIGTEHLLLGAVSHDPDVLVPLGHTGQEIRDVVMATLAGPKRTPVEEARRSRARITVKQSEAQSDVQPGEVTDEATLAIADQLERVAHAVALAAEIMRSGDRRTALGIMRHVRLSDFEAPADEYEPQEGAA